MENYASENEDNYRKLVCHCCKVFKAASLCKSAASACWTAAVFFFEVFDELPFLLHELSLENNAYKPEKRHHRANHLRWVLLSCCTVLHKIKSFIIVIVTVQMVSCNMLNQINRWECFAFFSSSHDFDLFLFFDWFSSQDNYLWKLPSDSLQIFGQSSKIRPSCFFLQ